MYSIERLEAECGIVEAECRAMGLSESVIAGQVQLARDAKHVEMRIADDDRERLRRKIEELGLAGATALAGMDAKYQAAVAAETSELVQVMRELTAELRLLNARPRAA